MRVSLSRFRRTTVVSAAVAAIGLLAVGTATTNHLRSPQPPTRDGFSMYFRDDGVGANMRALAATSCGTERWPVKTMTDKDRHQVRLHAKSVTIRWLRSQPKPDNLPAAHRIKPVELHTYRVHARLVDYVLEDDGDYHLILSRHGRTIIAEIPEPSCVGRTSPVRHRIKVARRHMDAQYDVTTSFKSAHRRVVVTGVGFFDYLHNQNGVAPNGIELHPVTGLKFG